MNRYRVDIEVAGRPHVRVVRAVEAGKAAHLARMLVVEDGWLPEHIGHIHAENEADPHDYWESKRRDKGASALPDGSSPGGSE